MEIERDLVVVVQWVKMSKLNHGVREKSNSFGKERERERNDWEFLRRVGEPVWEGGFGTEVFLLSVWLCEKMLKKCYFD